MQCVYTYTLFTCVWEDLDIKKKKISGRMHQSYRKKLCWIYWILKICSLCCVTKLFTWACERSRKLLSLSPAICFYYALENYNISRQLTQLCLPIAKDNLFQRDRMSQHCTKTVNWKASFDFCFLLTVKNLLV